MCTITIFKTVITNLQNQLLNIQKHTDTTLKPSLQSFLKHVSTKLIRNLTQISILMSLNISHSINTPGDDKGQFSTYKRQLFQHCIHSKIIVNFHPADNYGSVPFQKTKPHNMNFTTQHKPCWQNVQPCSGG